MSAAPDDNQNHGISEEARYEERPSPVRPRSDQPAQPAPPTARDQERTDKPAKKKKPLLKLGQRTIFLLVIATVLLVVGGVLWWLHARRYESTDDAFIDARSFSVSPQVSGAIVAVPVTDNTFVTAGAVLARIDDRNYRAALDQANAQVNAANASIANLDAQIAAQNDRIDAANKQVTEADAALKFAIQQNNRAQNLLRSGYGSRETAQQMSSTLRQQQAVSAAAIANAGATQKQLDVLQTQRQSTIAQLQEAAASREQAALNLSYTVVTAPTAGWVTKLSAAVGAYVQAGQSLMMFVPDRLWVTANFKESAITRMRPGEPVTISIDAYPGHAFHGRVASIQAGSGAAFSLLPPENATGNYVKVVQRVPVKIVFDQPPDVHIGPGMSVVPTVKVR